MKSEKAITMVIVFGFTVLVFVGCVSASTHILSVPLTINETAATQLIQPSALEYKGAFRLPEGLNGSSWEYSGAAMTYYPDGDPGGSADGHPGSIFAVGHDWQMYVSEISIPVPVISSTKNPDDLNTATTLQEFRDVRAGLFDPLVEIIRVGMEYLPAQGDQTSDKLYFAWGQHYQEEGSPEFMPSHMWCELNLSNPDTAGSWWVGEPSISIYSVNDYMFEIPEDWAAANTPGNLLATGRFRDGGWSGQGPSIYAIGPWNDGNPPAPDTRLNATTLLHYDSSYTPGGHTMSDYHHSDEWSGGAWLTSENKSAVIFVGTKGTGDCWYGCADGTDEPPWPDNCDRGWWSTDFEGQIIFYDSADLAAVARGEMETWEPQPYASLNIDQYLYSVKSTQQKYHIRAVSFDRARGLLYIFEPFADNDKGLVHIWSVKNRDTNITFWTERSTVKIRPFDSPGSEQSINIKAAKNEYEAFQVAVTAPEGLTDVNVSVSDLTGSGGSISHEYIRLYREAYMNVVTPSNIEGETGLWPDALIPAVDPFFDETRNAFPFDVPAGQNRAIWVDVFVPPTTNAGTYTGNLTITASGKNPALVPITLTVWNFTLPSTYSLKSAFGFDGWELLVGHYGNHDHHDQIVPLSKLYAESGLMHRISLETVTQEDWSILPWPATNPIDWTEFDANWSPFLDGIDLPYGPHGARLTSLMISTCGDTDEERVVYWQHYVSHFKDKGWFDRLFDYSWDEPHEPADFVELKKRASLINQADPDLRILVTTNIKYGQQYDLIGIIDVWVPIINEMDDKPGEVCWYSPYAGNQRDQYNELLAAGNELWWYQSCMSHGCYEIGGECYSGWPSYMIDIPAIYNRIMSWQSFKYNISGELYFSTNYAFEFNDYGSKDPWNNQYYFGGNGDGTLFYPGRPDKIGGTHHIPIESIRLKMIREGMEDYEYMKMLQDLGYESFAKSQVDSVVTNAYTFSHDPAALYRAQENMAGQILAHGITYYVATTGDDSNLGTIDQPWRTIQHAVGNDVGPGDTIFVREGTYNEWISISNSGLPEQPITLRGYPNETVILNGSGLEWRYGIDIGGADYWTIQDLVVQDYIREGLRGFGFVSWFGSKGITLCNLEFSLVGTPIKFHEGGEDILIEDIYAHDYDNGGFDCGPAGSCFNLTIRRFTAQGADEGDDTGVDGFAVEEGNNILVEDCIAEGHPGDGFDFKSDSTTLRRVISRNNARNNIKLWGQDSRLENCLSHDSGLTNLVLAEGGSYTVINCLIANRDTYGYLAVVGYDLPLDTPLRIHNTIFYNDDPAMGGTTLYLGEGVNLTADHNMYYNPYREADVICAGFLGGQCFNKDDINNGTWFTASGCGEHSVYADPLFVNAPIHDYHLTEESPAVNAGTAEEAPHDDLNGNPRPQGAGFDIGPYEYVGDELTVTWVDNDFNESTLGWHYDHFDNIQDGIDAVAENGTVFVYNGTYYENVVVNKTIDLIGEDRNTTTIDGSGTGDVVYVAADLVNISGFSIRNGSEDGICILSCSNHSINGNNIYNNSAGISLYSSNRSSISNNTLHHNTMEGVVLWKFSNNNIVGENNISSNQWGIEIGYSSDNRILDNEVFNNYFGIEIDNSTNITVENNKVYGNHDYGIELVNSSNNNINANHIISNINNGIDLWYNATGNRIRDNWIEGNNGWGIELGFLSNNLLYNNYFNNTNNAWDNGNNSWNITKTSGTNVIGGEYIGGNYWSDYTGVDNNADGLGDTPYNIAGGSNKDYLPLVSVGISITSPENRTYASVCVRLNFTVEPEGAVLDWIGYSLDGGANVTIAGNMTVGGLGACEHNIVVYARDSNGNTGASNMVYFTLHPGDINGDGVVDVSDLQRLAWTWGSGHGNPKYNACADLNCDGNIDVADLQILAWNISNVYPPC